MIAAKKMLLSGSGISASDPDARALIQRMNKKPVRQRQRLINDTIVALKDAGLWGGITGLWFPAAHDVQAGSLNWRGTTGTLAASGTFTFLADQGFKLLSGALNANGVARNPMMTAENLCVSSQFSGNVGLVQPIIIANAGLEFFYNETQANTFMSNNNPQGGLVSFPRAVERQIFLSRTSLSSYTVRQNGSLLATLTNGVGANSELGPSVSGGASVGGDGASSIFRNLHVGTGLSSNQMTAFRSIVASYLNTLGVAA